MLNKITNLSERKSELYYDTCYKNKMLYALKIKQHT